VREAHHTGDEVDAVLAYDSGLAWIDVGSEYQSAIVKHSAQHARTQLDLALATTRPDGDWPVAVHPLAVTGSPAEVLVEIARDADLLVVGSRGRGAFAGLLLGSTSQRCAERSSCPVVVVPAPRSNREDGGGS
jgi:nucleotide-binding universal stress UspA family protein